jgi:16S rRNA (adenine1518-N6/adenine1519-N6)-dimethyltransferase
MKHTPRKRFGQNFLQDKNIIHNMVRAFNLQASDHVLEIGPGQGALTQVMLPMVRQLDAIEIDRDLHQGLLTTLASQHPTFKVHLLDALTCQLSDYLTAPGEQLRVVGNLPYNISTPLLFHLLSQTSCIQDMHFMLQKEVVERMAAPVNSADYGRLSVMIQYYCHVDHLLGVPPTAFYPQPQVDSAVVRLTPRRREDLSRAGEEKFAEIVRQAFNQRRKTLHNSLKGLIDDQQLLTCGVQPSLRPQQITVENFIKIAKIAT